MATLPWLDMERRRAAEAGDLAKAASIAMEMLDQTFGHHEEVSLHRPRGAFNLGDPPPEGTQLTLDGEPAAVPTDNVKRALSELSRPLRSVR